MDLPFIDRIDAAGTSIPLPDSGIEGALRQGEPFHREVRTQIKDDYVAWLRRMAEEGARVIQLVDENEVRAIAIWRSFLTTYCGRRFEIDDIVTAEGHLIKGIWRNRDHGTRSQGALTLMQLRDAELGNMAKDAHRFYFRQRYTIDGFLFIKSVS